MNPSLKLVLPAAGEWRLSLPQARLCPRGVNPSLNLNLKLVLLVSLLAPGSASQWRLSLPRARVPLLMASLSSPPGPPAAPGRVA